MSVLYLHRHPNTILLPLKYNTYISRQQKLYTLLFTICLINEDFIISSVYYMFNRCRFYILEFIICIICLIDVDFVLSSVNYLLNRCRFYVYTLLFARQITADYLRFLVNIWDASWINIEYNLSSLYLTLWLLRQQTYS